MEPAAPLPTFSRAETIWLYWLKDHGILRALWTNFHKLDDQVWRQNHPSPARLAQLKAMGVASVLSLRGHTSAVSQMEAAACAELGLTHRTIRLRAQKLPKQVELAALFDAFRDMPKPMVVHCKSGSDRTGLASVIYLHAFKGVPLDEARAELSPRYLHNPLGKARVVYRLLDAYGRAHADTGIGMEDWVRTQYDPKALA